jgi:hypothetical protein
MHCKSPTTRETEQRQETILSPLQERERKRETAIRKDQHAARGRERQNEKRTHNDSVSDRQEENHPNKKRPFVHLFFTHSLIHSSITSAGLGDITWLLKSTRIKTIQLFFGRNALNDGDATHHIVSTLQHKNSALQDLPDLKWANFQCFILARINVCLTRNQTVSIYSWPCRHHHHHNNNNNSGIRLLP